MNNHNFKKVFKLKVSLFFSTTTNFFRILKVFQYIAFHPRTVAETDSAMYLTIDTVGDVQGADVELSTNAGDLVLAPAGNVQIMKGGSLNQAVCWKSQTILGYCSDVINSSGGCTCN